MCLTLQEKSIIFLLHILNLKNPPTISITYCTLLSVVIGRLDLRETGKRGKHRDNARYLSPPSLTHSGSAQTVLITRTVLPFVFPAGCMQLTN